METVAVTGAFALILLWILGVTLYLVPTIIAISRDHPNKVAIILINFFLGWSVFGWVGALIWSVLAIPEKKQLK